MQYCFYSGNAISQFFAKESTTVVENWPVEPKVMSSDPPKEMALELRE